ncbi:MAG TPA: hypothetical protein VGI60_10030 [Chthoniobacterales bacterium]|jgi:hypothetical protein
MNNKIIANAQSLRCVLLASLLATLSLGLSTVRGDLLFTDSFEYPTGPLAGQGPPADAPPGQTGWTLVSGNPQVTATGLHFPHVFSAGGGTSFLATHGDHVVANFTPVTSGVVWLGFLINLTGGSNNGFAVVNLSNGGTPTGYGVLFDQQVFGIDNDIGGSGSAAFTNISPGVTPNWLVVELDFDAGTQTLFVNPTHDAGEPQGFAAKARLRMTTAFQMGGISQIFLNTGLSTGQWGFDEVRISTTLADLEQ